MKVLLETIKQNEVNAKPLLYFQNKVHFDFQTRKCNIAKDYAILRTGGESIIGFNFSHFWMEAFSTNSFVRLLFPRNPVFRTSPSLEFELKPLARRIELPAC